MEVLTYNRLSHIQGISLGIFKKKKSRYVTRYGVANKENVRLRNTTTAIRLTIENDRNSLFPPVSRHPGKSSPLQRPRDLYLSALNTAPHSVVGFLR